MPVVLLVDDDPAMLRLLEVNFRLEGFETVSATHGIEALAAAGEQRPDAVVLDVMLPGIDGFEVQRRMRAEPGLVDVPIVFLTGRMFDDPDAGAGATFLAKPFDPAVLVGMIRDRTGAGT